MYNRNSKIFFLFFFILSFSSVAQQHTLIKNVSIWDGVELKILESHELLIKENFIIEIGNELNIPEETRIIDGKGGVLIPGLSDAHVHLAFVASSSDLRNDVDPAYAAIISSKSANNFLMQGFTSVRDLGGPVFGLKKAIDMGHIPGPRIFPSGAFIGQTSGHSDMRNPNEPHPYWSDNGVHPMEARGWNFLADGPTEVLKASRENLKKGASQLKVMAGGGISSEFDPLHSIQYTLEELQASVQAAENWDTYVAVHAYTPKSIQRALIAGVKCIDHGQLIDEESMKLLKEKDAWLVPQSYWSLTPNEQIDQSPPHVAKKQRMVYAGANKEMELAKRYKVNLAFGTDAVGSADVDDSAMVEFTSRTRWFTPVEVLKQATSENARLFELSGAIHPYPHGRLGVIKIGAYADLLIYNQNPLQDIQVILNYGETLKLVMKGGQIFKNEL